MKWEFIDRLTACRRVAGGYIYRSFNAGGTAVALVFVPDAKASKKPLKRSGSKESK